MILTCSTQQVALVISFSVGRCVRINFCRNFLEAPVLLPYLLLTNPLRALTITKILESKGMLHLSSTYLWGKLLGRLKVLASLFWKGYFLDPLVLWGHIRPISDFAYVAWFTGYSCDIKLLEGVQRWWTKRIAGFQDLSDSEYRTQLSLHSIKGSLIRANVIIVFKIWMVIACTLVTCL